MTCLQPTEGAYFGYIKVNYGCNYILHIWVNYGLCQLCMLQLPRSICYERLVTSSFLTSNGNFPTLTTEGRLEQQVRITVMVISCLVELNIILALVVV